MSDDALIAALERRIDLLESAQAIEALQGGYMRAVADRDLAQMLQAYADDARVAMRGRPLVRGRREIERLLAGLTQGEHIPRAGFILSSPVITVEGDRAQGRWTWHKLHCEFPTATGMLRVWGPWCEGRYHGEYVREGGRWKFQSVQLRVVLPDPDPEPSE